LAAVAADAEDAAGLERGCKSDPRSVRPISTLADTGLRACGSMCDPHSFAVGLVINSRERHPSSPMEGLHPLHRWGSLEAPRRAAEAALLAELNAAERELVLWAMDNHPTVTLAKTIAMLKAFGI
jgi:hypothetical protein